MSWSRLILNWRSLASLTGGFVAGYGIGALDNWHSAIVVTGIALISLGFYPRRTRG